MSCCSICDFERFFDEYIHILLDCIRAASIVLLAAPIKCYVISFNLAISIITIIESTLAGLFITVKK